MAESDETFDLLLADATADLLQALAEFIGREFASVRDATDDKQLLSLITELNDDLVPLVHDFRRLARNPEAALSAPRDRNWVAMTDRRVDAVVALATAAEERADELEKQSVEEPQKKSQSAEIKAKATNASSAAKKGLKRVWDMYKTAAFFDLVPRPRDLLEKLNQAREAVEQHGWKETAEGAIESGKDVAGNAADLIESIIEELG